MTRQQCRDFLGKAAIGAVYTAIAAVIITAAVISGRPGAEQPRAGSPAACWQCGAPARVSRGDSLLTRVLEWVEHLVQDGVSAP